MRKLLPLLTLFLIISGAANACTNFIVTKGASVDGSTMITYTADSYYMYGDLYHSPAAKYPEGTMLEIFDFEEMRVRGKIKQALQTYNVVGNMNEFQLAIGETTFGGREELVNPEGVLDYWSLIYITLQRAKTAREAIKIMTELVEEYGYGSSGESFSIGDPNEAWILEMVGKGPGKKGAVWVAYRIPDGYVSGHANQARITKFPQNDPDNCFFSPDVISFAREKGYYTGSDTDFDFAEAYAPLDFGAIRFCDARVWSLFRRCTSGMDKYLPYIRGESRERMPLFVKPDSLLSVHDVMGLMRDHYDGTELDMTVGIGSAPYGNPTRARPLVWKYQEESYFNERPISTPQTAWSFISQSRAGLPDEVGGVLWFGMDDTYTTVWFPLYCSITDIPANYKVGVGSFSEFTWESAFWVFNSVANFAYPRFNLVIGDIKEVQAGLELGFLAKQPEIEAEALKLLGSSKEKAVAFLTGYSVAAGKQVYDTWKKLNGDLLLHYFDGVKKDSTFRVVNVGYPDSFKKQIVAESGDILKMREIPGIGGGSLGSAGSGGSSGGSAGSGGGGGSSGSSFGSVGVGGSLGNMMSNAKKLIGEKDYTAAKTELEKALAIDPGNEEVKSELKKVNQLLKEIEDLHSKLFGSK